MLDADTKRRIDTARDILVGKVPDPKSQVEQITIALIYKFMDDLDAESEQLGGERKFFAGEFARYGWAKLTGPGIGGHEMLNLYAEAVARMPENPGIPPLFREIFKNAFLPYRDPETLRAFLKVIGEFAYDHSERLGDAFEYLLSVLGSQGDAGQFRTPRHIIDFIVAVIDPKKEDVVLDPACGTAGFLISAYKHVMASNTDADGHSTLAPDDRGRLADNFRGYDISPDMVRLSLVNMYLHGFREPHIHEYDTLTSEDRWNEYADAILANPPFMSPKGGIRPHNRFSIQSKRSEVLFVDYMAEHLTPSGRAGIIVPEGIIFQSQTAHRQLRKMLVEDYLVAVVSLPAGVFNPYSGVKTSILFLDRALAKRTDSIAFFKVENDGFDLGAQRRQIDRNDLPKVQAELAKYLAILRSAQPSSDLQLTLGQIVQKERLAADGEWNLSRDRYRDGKVHISQWPVVPLGELLELEFGTRITKRNDAGTLYPVYGGGGESFRTDTFNREDDVVISRFAMSAECVRVVTGKFHLLDSGFTFSLSERFSGRVVKSFVTLALLHMQEKIYECARGHAQKNIDVGVFQRLEIPVPPLEVQREIVAEIEGYQKVIDGARAVVDNYRPHIPVDPEWPLVSLDSVCHIRRGKFAHRPRNEPRFYNGKYPFIQTGDVARATGRSISYTQTLNDEGLAISRLFEPPVVVITIAANIGETAVLDFPACFPDSVVGLIPRQEVNAWFLELMMRTKKEFLNEIAPQSAQKNINVQMLRTVEIPLPPPEVQQSIVKEIQDEQAIIGENRKLIQRFDGKIRKLIGQIWDQGGHSRLGNKT